MVDVYMHRICWFSIDQEEGPSISFTNFRIPGLIFLLSKLSVGVVGNTQNSGIFLILGTLFPWKSPKVGEYSTFNFHFRFYALWESIQWSILSGKILQPFSVGCKLFVSMWISSGRPLKFCARSFLLKLNITNIDSWLEH